MNARKGGRRGGWWGEEVGGKAHPYFPAAFANALK